MAMSVQFSIDSFYKAGDMRSAENKIGDLQGNIDIGVCASNRKFNKE